MSLSRKLEFINISDTGRKRPHNEDSAITDTAIGLAVIADGMGGYKAGEVASAIAGMLVLERVRAGLPALGSNGSPEAVGKLLRECISEANAPIFTTAQQDDQCQGMGTTVVATLFYNNRVIIAHVGDSRIYRFKNNELSQMTVDHSLMQELIDRGFYTPEEAAANTPRNLVTRALGIEDSVQVDIRDEKVDPGDIFLLCSDGLNDMVSDEEIRLTLSKYSANLVSAAHELVRLANANGGKDNISVVLARPREKFPARPGLVDRLSGWIG